VTEAAGRTVFSCQRDSIPANGMNGDIDATPGYRAHLVGVLARRAQA
jgi:hypothetical protein